MKKLERRAILCLALAAVLMAGIVFYVMKLTEEGGAWVSYPANQHLYNNGYISKGVIYDRSGNLLVRNNSKGKKKFNSSSAVRRATVHVVGDKVGNIATGADVVFADKLVGYDLINGTYTTNNQERELYLTIDNYISQVANEALDGRNGTVYAWSAHRTMIRNILQRSARTTPPEYTSTNSSATAMFRARHSSS